MIDVLFKHKFTLMVHNTNKYPFFNIYLFITNDVKNSSLNNNSFVICFESLATLDISIRKIKFLSLKEKRHLITALSCYFIHYNCKCIECDDLRVKIKKCCKFIFGLFNIDSIVFRDIPFDYSVYLIGKKSFHNIKQLYQIIVLSEIILNKEQLYIVDLLKVIIMYERRHINSTFLCSFLHKKSQSI